MENIANCNYTWCAWSTDQVHLGDKLQQHTDLGNVKLDYHESNIGALNDHNHKENEISNNLCDNFPVDLKLDSATLNEEITKEGTELVNLCDNFPVDLCNLSPTVSYDLSLSVDNCTRKAYGFMESYPGERENATVNLCDNSPIDLCDLSPDPQSPMTDHGDVYTDEGNSPVMWHR